MMGQLVLSELRANPLSELNAMMSAPRGKALTVRLGERLHAIPIEGVEEVLPALPIEPVPQCPVFVRGVVFVRGHLIPVLSAAERLGLTDYQRPDEPHIVCIRLAGRIVGVEFDEAIDLIDVDDDETLDANELGASAGFFSGVIDHDGQIIRFLDPEKLISKKEAAQLEQVPRKSQ